MKRRVILILIGGLLLWHGVAELRHRIPLNVSAPQGKPQVAEFEVTGYCHCGKCCSYFRLMGIPLQRTGLLGWRLKKVGYTADGSFARPGMVAADPEVLPFGSVVQVEGYGYAVVADTGGLIKGRSLDLYFPSHRKAQACGRHKMKVRYWVRENAAP